MALKYFETVTAYSAANPKDSDVCFVEEEKAVYTHGEKFGGSDSTPTTITLNKTYLRIPQPASSSSPCVLQIVTNMGGFRIVHILEMGLPYDEPAGYFYMFGNSWDSPLRNGEGSRGILYAYNSTAGTGAYYFEISDTTATAEVTLLSGTMPSISTENSLVSGDSWLSDYDNMWCTVDRRSPMSVRVDDTKNRLILIEDGTRTYAYYSTIVSGGGGEITSHKVTSLSSSSTTTQYPSAKTTYDEIHPAVGTSIPSGGMKPNVFYNLGTITAGTTMSMASPVSGIYNEYQFQFSIGSTVPTITWDNSITGWIGGSSAPTLQANTTYEVSVVNGLAVIASF